MATASAGLEDAHGSIEAGSAWNCRNAHAQVEAFARLFVGLGPQATLRRGFTIARDDGDRPITSREAAIRSPRFVGQLHDGSFPRRQRRIHRRRGPISDGQELDSASLNLNYWVLQETADWLSGQKEPDIDQPVPKVDTAMKAYSICKERLDKVQATLGQFFQQDGNAAQLTPPMNGDGQASKRSDRRRPLRIRVRICRSEGATWRWAGR